MRLSIALLLLALAGVLGGAAIIGLPALGAAIIFDSLCVGYWATQRDDGTGPLAEQVPPRPRSVGDVLERARRAS